MARLKVVQVAQLTTPRKPVYLTTPETPYPSRDRSASSQIDAPGAYFDERKAALAVAFFERYLRHSTGEWAGRLFTLDPWQKRLVEDLWGWRRADGTRLYRRAFVAVPRKNGKTTLAAGIANALAFADGEPGAQVFSIAGNQEQARLVFDEACAMVAQSPELSQDVEILRNALYCAALRASFKPLAAKGRGQHGKNPHGIIGDELHEWHGREMYDAMQTAMGARRQPLEFFITTAGFNLQSVCWELWNHALKVRDGVVHFPSLLPVIFAADPGDDWTSPATWAKANPGLGSSIKHDYLKQKCEEAQQIATQENAFKQLHLNLWTEQSVRWLPMHKWHDAANAAPFDEAELIGRPCFIGVDLAHTKDLSALAVVFPPIEADPQWRVVMRFFVPEDGLRLRETRDFVTYTAWCNSGHLIATPGDIADYNAIERELLALIEKFAPREIAFDRMFAGSIINNLMERGHDCVGVGQGFYSMAAPCAELERAVLGKLFRHGGNPVLDWNASNVVAMRDERGNMKPDHRKSGERIDGISAIVTAMARALTPSESTLSPYAERGLLIL